MTADLGPLRRCDSATLRRFMQILVLAVVTLAVVMAATAPAWGASGKPPRQDRRCACERLWADFPLGKPTVRRASAKQGRAHTRHGVTATALHGKKAGLPTSERPARLNSSAANNPDRPRHRSMIMPTVLLLSLFGVASLAVLGGGIWSSEARRGRSVVVRSSTPYTRQ